MKNAQLYPITLYLPLLTHSCSNSGANSLWSDHSDKHFVRLIEFDLVCTMYRCFECTTSIRNASDAVSGIGEYFVYHIIFNISLSSVKYYQIAAIFAGSAYCYTTPLEITSSSSLRNSSCRFTVAGKCCLQSGEEEEVISGSVALSRASEIRSNLAIFHLESPTSKTASCTILLYWNIQTTLILSILTDTQVQVPESVSGGKQWYRTISSTVPCYEENKYKAQPILNIYFSGSMNRQLTI